MNEIFTNGEWTLDITKANCNHGECNVSKVENENEILVRMNQILVKVNQILVNVNQIISKHEWNFSKGEWNFSILSRFLDVLYFHFRWYWF